MTRMKYYSDMKLILFRTSCFLWLVIIIFAGATSATQAKEWLVGPLFSIKKPSVAIRKAEDGDIIKILAGVYENDYAVINQDNLTILGMNGFAYLKSSGPVPGGKAIWVINGKNIVIRNIEFSGTQVPDRNGAGIRLQSGSLTLDNCYFHDNEMGILTADNPAILLTIINSEFSRNIQDYPTTGSLSHNIYVGGIEKFVMENSISRGAKYGHTVKSRARQNIIRNNRIFDEGDVSASYLIDIPNGGIALIENNYLYRNKGAQNNALISYGAEGMKYDHNALSIKYNSAINEAGIAFLMRNHSDVTIKFIDNWTKNLIAKESPGIEREGLLERLKNKIRNYLK